MVGVGDVVRGLFARALVRGDVDPHCCGLGAREADGGAIGIEERASALFECLGGWIDDAHACEVVCCLAVRQYVKQTEKVSADSPGGRRDCQEEEEIAQIRLRLSVGLSVRIFYSPPVPTCGAPPKRPSRGGGLCVCLLLQYLL